jgi:ribosomal protein S18 acetylase RimI-like enzyme
MTKSNIERLIQLAEEVFAVKNDPDQLDVDQKVIERLKKIHPSTISEYNDGNGPVAWVLVIPTTIDLMKKFLESSITEKELFEQTPTDAQFEALYLCSALVLKEYRRKGIVRELTISAINTIRKDHPLKTLFVWSFSKEGDLTAETVARITFLLLSKKLEMS